jgi:DNA-binding transcriptional LysR family regulator
MIQNLSHDVQSLEQRERLLSVAQWDDLRVILAIGEAGSLRAAATALGLSVNTVRNRLDRLEHRCGQALLLRNRAGGQLTELGQILRQQAIEMKSAAAGATRHPASSGLAEIRIGASEAVGISWLLPRLPLLERKLGPEVASLHFEYDLSRDQAPDLDISLQFVRSEDQEMETTRIATLHFVLFASRDYLARKGTPQTIDDLLRFQLIEQVGPGIRSDLLDSLVGSDRPPGFIARRSNSGLAVFWSVLNGEGIAALPTYVIDVTDRLAPIGLPIQLRRELFMVHRRSRAGSPALREACAWLRACFDPDRYPWFGNNFVDPAAVGHRAASDSSGVFESFYRG